MTIKPFCICAVLSAVALFASPSHANDSSFGDDNGTIRLQRQPDIRMSKESLFISENLVQVDYVFTNTSDRDLVVPVAFPMPPVYFGYSDHSQLTDFKLWVDGQPVNTERRIVAMLDGEDVSAQWNASGWTVEELSALIHQSAMPQDKPPLPAHWIGENELPRFTLSEYFTWQQRFPAGQQVSIRHAYVPSVSSGVPQPASDIIASYADKTCLDAAARQGLLRRAREYGVEWANLRYILLTGNNWQGPIGDFKLTIKKRRPTDLVSLCFDGELKRADPLTFEFRQQNFVPRHDLDLLFVR